MITKYKIKQKMKLKTNSIYKTTKTSNFSGKRVQGHYQITKGNLKVAYPYMFKNHLFLKLGLSLFKFLGKILKSNSKK